MREFVDLGRKWVSKAAKKQTAEGGVRGTESDEADKLMWMLMLMLRQSKLPLRPRHARIILALMYPVLMHSPPAQ